LDEIALATIANQGRAMMSGANIPVDIRRKLVRKSFQTATLMDGLIPIMIDRKSTSRYEHQAG
jgi:hypothetical protein